MQFRLNLSFPRQKDLLLLLLGPVPLTQFVRLLLELLSQRCHDLGHPLPLEFGLADLEQPLPDVLLVGQCQGEA